jgi:hypothetical protein
METGRFEVVLKELSYHQFKSTMADGMTPLPAPALPAMDIWPHVGQLVDSGLVPLHVLEQGLVESVYRTASGTYDHVLLPTARPDVYVVLVVEIQKAQLLGYFCLDLEKEYGRS